MPLTHFALVLLLIFVWGFNFVSIGIALEGIPPVLLCCVRFFLTSIPAIFFIKPPKVPLKLLVAYGLAMFVLQYTLLFWGMHAGVAPGLAALLVQVHIFFSVLFGILFFQEKLHLWQIVGALISFSGIGLIGIHLEGGVTLTGFLLVIVSSAFWATGSAISKKIGKVNMISLVIWGSLVAWPPMLLLSFLVEGADKVIYSLSHLNWEVAGAALYTAYFATLFAFGFWSWMIHHHPLSKVAPFTLAIPVVAMLSSYLVMGEPLQVWKIYAGILVIGGLCVNLLGPQLARAMRRKR